MVDWPGLLKWSLSYSDGTRDMSTIKPMDEGTKKWLEEAMKEACVNEADEMKKIIDELSKPEAKEHDAIDQSRRVSLYEALMDLLDGLDNAKNFCLMGGLDYILSVMYGKTQYTKVRVAAFQIFASINQNNTPVQRLAVQKGAFQIINIVLNDPLPEVREAAMSALSCLVRGEYLDGIRTFVSVDGVELLLKILQSPDPSFTLKMKTKAATILKELMHHDPKMDLPYYAGEDNNIVKASKTVMHTPKTEEMKKEDEAEYEQKKKDCEKYKNSVRDRLVKAKFWTFLPEVLKDKTNKLHDYRFAYLRIIQYLITAPEVAAEIKELLPLIKQHLAEIEGKDPIDSELVISKELIASLEGAK